MSLSHVSRLLFAFFFVALFLYVLGEAWFGFGRTFTRSVLFPLSIGLPSLAIALATFVLEFRRPAPPPVSELGAVEEGPPLEPEVVRRRTVVIMSWVVGFFLAIWLLGFFIAVPVATFLYLKVGAKEKWLPTIILSVLSYAFFYGVFGGVLIRELDIPFPDGVLLEWAGGFLGS